jgi:rubrerythrin
MGGPVKNALLLVTAILAIGPAIGCQSDDARIAKMAERQADREAEHTRQMAQLQQQVAEGSRRLVEADSEARKELTELQRDLRSDQATVGQQRDALEADRRQIAADRRWDSVVGPAITAAAILLACILPLVVCVMALWGLRHPEQSSEVLSEILIEELVSERPRLLPRPLPRSVLEGPQVGSVDGAGVDF